MEKPRRRQLSGRCGLGGLLHCGNPRSTAEGVKKEGEQWEGTLRWDVSLSIIEIQLNVISGWTSLITQLCPSHSLTLIILERISYNLVFVVVYGFVPFGSCSARRKYQCLARCWISRTQSMLCTNRHFIRVCC